MTQNDAPDSPSPDAHADASPGATPDGSPDDTLETTRETSAALPTSVAALHSRKPSVIALLRTFGPTVALILLVVVTVATQYARQGSVTFLNPDNLLNILRQQSFIGIVALGMTFVIILGGIDLSVGSLAAFAGGMAILTVNAVLEGGQSEGVAIGAAAVICLLVGIAAGLFNGAVIVFGKVAPFVATLGGLAAYRSLAKAPVEAAEYRTAGTEHFDVIGNGGLPIPFLRNHYDEALQLPWPVIIFLLMAIAAWVLLRATRFGRYVVAIGCNERAAVYAAVPVKRVKLLTYTLVGLCCGVAAFLLASRMNSVASSSMGMLYELDAIAAVVIGGTAMRGGAGTIFGTVIGVIMLGVINNMLTMLGINVHYHGLVKGVIIIAAVLVQRFEERT